MKKIIFAIVYIVVAGALAVLVFDKIRPGDNKADGKVSKRAEAAFQPTDCPPIKRSLPVSGYQGPMIDTHIHIPPIPDGPFGGGFDDDQSVRPAMGVNVTIADYLCMMETEGTKQVFAFFPVWEPIVDDFIDVVKKTVEMYPDRFVPFIMPPDHDDRPDGFPTVDATELSRMLAVAPDVFQGYGEIGLYARGDHGGPTGAPELPPDSQRLKEIYPLLRENNLVVYFHLGEGQKESFERTLQENPDINFIFHGDQLIQYGGHDKYYLDDIEDILNNHRNVYYGVDELYGGEWLLRPEVSKEEFIAHFQNPESLLEEDVKTWKAFIERHPDQVLWGTDRGWSASWSLDPEVAIVLNDYSRLFIARLAPEVQEKFAYKNAEKLFSNNFNLID